MCLGNFYGISKWEIPEIFVELKVANLERVVHFYIVPLAGQGKIYFEVAAVSVFMQTLHPSAIFYGAAQPGLRNTWLDTQGKAHIQKCGGIVVESRQGPQVIKLFSCSAQLRLKLILLINVK